MAASSDVKDHHREDQNRAELPEHISYTAETVIM